MFKARMLGLAIVAGAAALGGCAEDYNGYGRGFATGYYTGPIGFGADYYAGYGYPTYGYFNDVYYPGFGIYVFDRYGHRRPWNDAERAHWEYRGQGWNGSHLAGEHGIDRRRDHAYMADRQAAFRNYRSGFRNGGNGGEHRRP